MDFYSRVSEALSFEKVKSPEQINALVLAYIGDTVFDLAVRSLLISTQGGKVQFLHRSSIQRVRASAQAEAMRALIPSLTEQENNIYLRARNTKAHTIPKNANPKDYADATALEAILGYLFLSEQQERMLEMIEQALQAQTVSNAPMPRPYKG